MTATSATPTPVTGGSAAPVAPRGRARLQERVLLHRAVSRTLQLLLTGPTRRRRRAAVPGPVRFLVWDLYETGGSLRSNLLLAEHLAQHRPTEVVSLLRTAEETFFPVPADLPTRVLDDRRPSTDHGLLQSWAGRLPSLLMHPDDRAITSFSLRSDLQLLRLLRSVHGGVLITTRPALHLIAARFCRPGVVVVAREHDNFTRRTEAVRSGLRSLSDGLDAVSVLTEGDRRDYDELLAAGGVRVFQQPNALQPLAGDPLPVREKVVLAAGRLEPQKGFDLLIAAFAPVAAQHPDWSLHIHGEGALRPALQAQIEELGLAGRVLLLPPTRSLGVVMGRSGLFVLSSRYEGFGRVLIEALSKSLPVVSFDCPRGPSDILTHGRDGLLVPAEDVAGLSRAISLLVEDAALRQRLGAAGPAAAARYDIESIGARWLCELDGMVRTRSGHPGHQDGPEGRPVRLTVVPRARAADEGRPPTLPAAPAIDEAAAG